MIIYTSEKVMPYVYMGIHRETKEFYIGSRTSAKQSHPSHIDLYRYRTSSKKVKPRFDQFDWFIIAEFFNAKDAYAFEQELICSNWGNVLLLNEVHHADGSHFTQAGAVRDDLWRMEHSAKLRGRKLSEEHKQKIAAALTGKPSPKKGKQYVHRERPTPLTTEERKQRSKDGYNKNPHTPERIEALRQRRIGVKVSAETIAKRQQTRKQNDELLSRSRKPVSEETRRLISEKKRLRDASRKAAE